MKIGKMLKTIIQQEIQDAANVSNRVVGTTGISYSNICTNLPLNSKYNEAWYTSMEIGQADRGELSTPIVVNKTNGCRSPFSPLSSDGGTPPKPLPEPASYYNSGTISNAILHNTNDSLHGGGTNVLRVRSKLRIEHGPLTGIITNTGNTDAMVEVYECKYRKDEGADGGVSLAGLWSVLGLAAPQAGDGLTMNSTISPFDSSLFCSAVKILKTSKQVLKPGAHIGVKCFTPLPETPLFAELLYTQQVTSKWTRGFLVFVKGMPISDNSIAGDEPDGVRETLFGPFSCAITWKTWYRVTTFSAGGVISNGQIFNLPAEPEFEGGAVVGANNNFPTTFSSGYVAPP